MEKHFIYHMFDHKVGATQDVVKRCEDKLGARPHEYEVVAECYDLDLASYLEEKIQDYYGYKHDQNTYKKVKNMRRKLQLRSQNDNNVGFNKGLKNKAELLQMISNGLIIKLSNGSKIVFEADEAEDLLPIIEASQYETSDFYIPIKKARNLREELDNYATEQEITAALEMEVTAEELDGFTENGWTRGGDPIKNLKLSASDPVHAIPTRQQNNCSGLEVGNLKSNDFDEVFLMQQSLQQKFIETQNIGDGTETLAQIATMAQRNLHAFMDEAMEFMDAIGGINDGYGNGAWKYWKKDHAKAHEDTLKDLSPNDLKELQMEVVDMFHFFINFALMTGMTGSDLFNMYVSKNAENFNRQKRGY